ncbi:RNA polymerase II subunit A C-terminal domain phosphatase SSU72-like [Teleopsis dalmanni]|uniref:RNA polymerase II subunit A C-terminal domain phosphatase SSU72-like n=1 Tax=Teleopsis dalmanni TaxID=139649 RepID=UPI0018CC86CF|nr:RNA polymerase II subunit A C-terminal domain phosphatase SSU72-like [Teleopsis dalmanni]XP_037960279.1 RNA polymerase II subunit A C-terminal domain phosphatase SSU72-like [Teleopsis dalmanni]
MLDKKSLTIAIVCYSNMNRSMNAQCFLTAKGYNVKSYGVGDTVQIAGKTPDKPNVYEFGTTFDAIYQDLVRKDKKFYEETGLLEIVDRNRAIKRRPERFQDCNEQFDIIITVQEYIYDLVVEFIAAHEVTQSRPVHIINLNIEDSLEMANYGSFLISDILGMVIKTYDLASNIKSILRDFEVRNKMETKHIMQYY